VLLLLLRAIREDKGFIWPEKGSFKAGYKKEVWKVLWRSLYLRERLS
jgi:hypothetical protein